MQPPWRVLGRVLIWPLTPALVAGSLLAQAAGSAAPVPVSQVVAVAAALAACWLTGVVVTAQAPEPRAGWAFLGLATALAWSVFCDAYSDLGHVERFGVPAWRLVAALGDTSFVWWLVFLILVLLFTPPGAGRGPARALPAATVTVGVLFQLAALVRGTPLDAPRGDLTSPLAVAALDGPARALAAVAVYLLPAFLIAAVGLLVRAWVRSAGESRRQLLWLVTGALPLIPCVIAAFALSAADREDLAAAVLGVAMVALVLGAGLSVLRYRLYDVERVVTESAGYAIASAAVLIAYAGVVVVVTRSGPLDAGSPPVTIVATLAGVAVARVSYVWGHRAVGRRVNPQRYRAVETIRNGLSDAATNLDELVQRAAGPGTRAIYPIPAAPGTAGGTWVTSDGRTVEATEPGVDVHRRQVVVARLEFDPRETPRDVAEAVAREASAELDNVALRAELVRHLELVRASRARLATAHQEERRRIERDLHDGTQQRLLAMALRLRSARLNGSPAVLETEVDAAIEGLRMAVRELRDLSAGLQPAALAGGGLVAAVTQMADRLPLTLKATVCDDRFPAPLETAAWFVVAEGVANAVKHAGTDRVNVDVRRSGDGIEVRVTDEGCGGADRAGRGLQGLADRVAALGGSLDVGENRPRGTVLEARLPCGS